MSSDGTQAWSIINIKVVEEAESPVPDPIGDVSENLLSFLRKREGCILYLYDDLDTTSPRRRWDDSDKKGNPTIGIGHLVSKSSSDFEYYRTHDITLAEAYALKEADIVRYVNYAKQFTNDTGISLNQHQFDALVSYFYNCGYRSDFVNFFKGKTLSSIPTWQIYNIFAYPVTASGSWLAGLYTRRMDEATMFVNGTYYSANYGESSWSLPSWWKSSTISRDMIPSDWYPIELGNINTGVIVPEKVVFTNYSDSQSVVLSDVGTYLTIRWSTASNAVSYKYSVKVLNGEPTGGDNEAGTSLYTNKETTSQYLSITKSKLTAGKWLKVAVASVSSDGSQAWSILNLKLVETEQIIPGKPVFTNYTDRQTVAKSNLGTYMTISWAKAVNAVSYKYSAKILDDEPTGGDNESGTSLYTNKETTGQSFSISTNKLVAGKWLKIAVASISSDGNTTWSIINLKITENELVVPDPVTFTNYSDAQTVELSSLGAYLTVKWADAFNAEKYLVSAKILRGEPNGSDNEEALATLYNRRDCGTNTSISITASKLTDGKWLKVAVASVSSDGTEAWSILYLKIVDQIEESPDSHTAILSSASATRSSVNNGGISKISLTVSFAYADIIEVRFLKDGVAYPFSDDWNANTTKRIYQWDDFYAEEALMYSSAEVTKQLSAYTIPSTTPLGNYVFEIKATNRFNLPMTKTIAVEVTEPGAITYRTISTVYNQRSYSNYWMPNTCPTYPDVAVQDTASSRTLQSSGCGIFTIAHAIEWLTGEVPDIATVRNYCGNTANYSSGMCGSAMTYIDSVYGIEHEAAKATDDYLKGVFDKGGVVVSATSDGDHYFLATEYLEYNGETYVHIIDSSTGSTLTRGYRAYWMDSMDPINSYRDICTSGYYGEGHDYWITMSQLKSKVLLSLTKTGAPHPAVAPGKAVFSNYSDNETVYLSDLGAYLTIKWTAAENAEKYLVSAKVLKSDPNGGDNEEALTTLYSNKDNGSSCSISITKTKLVAEKWLKVAVASVSESGLQTWNIINLKILEDDSNAPGKVVFLDYTDRQEIEVTRLAATAKFSWSPAVNAVKYLVTAKILKGEPTGGENEEALVTLYNNKDVGSTTSISFTRAKLTSDKWLKIAVAAVGADGTKTWSFLNVKIVNTASTNARQSDPEEYDAVMRRIDSNVTQLMRLQQFFTADGYVGDDGQTYKCDIEKITDDALLTAYQSWFGDTANAAGKSIDIVYNAAVAESIMTQQARASYKLADLSEFKTFLSFFGLEETIISNICAINDRDVDFLLRDAGPEAMADYFDQAVEENKLDKLGVFSGVKQGIKIGSLLTSAWKKYLTYKSVNHDYIKTLAYNLRATKNNDLMQVADFLEVMNSKESLITYLVISHTGDYMADVLIEAGKKAIVDGVTKLTAKCPQAFAFVVGMKIGAEVGTFVNNFLFNVDDIQVKANELKWRMDAAERYESTYAEIYAVFKQDPVLHYEEFITKTMTYYQLIQVVYDGWADFVGATEDAGWAKFCRFWTGDPSLAEKAKKQADMLPKMGVKNLGRNIDAFYYEFMYENGYKRTSIPSDYVYYPD